MLWVVFFLSQLCRLISNNSAAILCLVFAGYRLRTIWSDTSLRRVLQNGVQVGGGVFELSFFRTLCAGKFAICYETRGSGSGE